MPLWGLRALDDASRAYETPGWSRSAQDQAEADFAALAADESSERLGNDEPLATPFLERRIGYGTGRGLLIAIVVILVVTAAWIISGRSFQPL